MGGAAVVAGAAEPVLSTANGRELTPEGIPERVPAPMAAAVVDSLLETAMAAMLEATGLVVDVAGVLVLMEELGLVLDGEANELPPPLVLELTSCPADVGKAAVAPEGAEAAAVVDEEPDAAAGATIVAVDPRRGTAAGAPLEPALM